MAEAKKSNVGMYIALGAVAYGIYQYVLFTNNPSAKLVDIGFNGAYIDGTFMLNNPTDLNGTLDNLTGQLIYRGTPIASATTNAQPIVVPSGLPFTVKVKMQPDYVDALLSLPSIITNYNPYDFRFVGQMRFSGIPIPINTSLA